MMTIANYTILRDNTSRNDLLKEDDELEYTFQYSLLSKVDQKSVTEHKAKTNYKQQVKSVNKSSTPTPIEHLVFEEDKYPSDHFGLFDAILGIISLVVLFILFW